MNTLHMCLTRRVLVAGSLLLPLALTGCGGEQADAAEPPDISYGRDTCDRCGMIISDERYAGGLVATDGTVQIFDDIGEMLQSAREATINDRQVWVHDWTSREWTDATTAAFVRASPETTPMGTGLHAFSDHEAAAAFAADQGIEANVVTWADLMTEEMPATPAHQM